MSPHDAVNDRNSRLARSERGSRRARVAVGWLVFVALSFSGAMAAKRDRTAQLLNDALQAIRAGRATDAAAKLEALLEEKPESAAAHHYLGLAYEKQGRHGAAMLSLMRALELEPTRLAALAPLGWSQFYLGRTVSARGSFRLYLEVAPGDPSAHLGLGLVEAEDGHPDRARLHFLETIQLAHARDNDAIEARARSALADVELRNGNLLTAVRLLEAAIRLRPADGALRLKLAHALDLSGDPEGAAAARAAHAGLSAKTAPH